MKKILLGILLGLISLNLVSQEISTYYMIRHAEKVITEDGNPDLTSIGKLRAEEWAEIFKDVAFDAIYSTDYIRTIATAKPTADSKKLDITFYHPTKINVKKFLRKTSGKTVLIVGHSNTIPSFVNQLIDQNKYPNIEDDNNGNLYIIELGKTFNTDKLLHIK